MVRAALRKRYAAPEFALFEEVRNGTGGYGTRSADAVAMGLWPSRGIEIHGIEIKVRRSDWLSELKNPQKADEIAQYCDRWWLAVGDETVVKSGELPATWGLVVLRGDVLVQRIEAPALSPIPPSRMFIAALLRRVAHGLEKLQATARIEGYQRAEATMPATHERDMTQLRQESERSQELLASFELASGIQISKWSHGTELGEQFARFMALRKMYDPKPVEQLQHAAQFLEREAARLREFGARLEDQRDIAQAVSTPTTSASEPCKNPDP